MAKAADFHDVDGDRGLGPATLLPDLKNSSRREFLKMGGLTLPALIVGNAGASLQQIGRTGAAVRVGNVNLEQPCDLLTPRTGVGLFDIHTHIFNASDLQVERFLVRAIAPGLPLPLRPVIRLLAPILQKAGWASAPDGDTELAKLNEFELESKVGTAAGTKVLERDRQDGLSRFSEAMGQQLRTTEGQHFLEAYRIHQGTFLARTPGLSRSQKKTARRFALLELGRPQHLLEQIEIERQIPGLPPIFNFVSRFFQYRYVNAAYLLATAGCKNELTSSGDAGVFSCLMVDFDYPLGAARNPPPTSLDKQIEVLGRIAVISKGRILPFVSFDPWRFVYEGESALTRVINAVQTQGAVGVKLYPSMGFAPLGNAEVSPEPNWPLNDFPDFGKRLDKAERALLAWCVSEDVPVLAHSNPSNGAHPSFLNLGKPENWREALKAYPGLRICFGHFGGPCLLASPKNCKKSSGWPARFLQTFSSSGAQNAFGDWSYFSDVLGEHARELLTARARAFYKSGGEVARNRILYGSDWFWVGLESHSDFYYRNFALLLQDLEPDFPGLTRQFFVGNASRYLGLNGATGKRMTTFLNRNGVAPEWLKSVLPLA